MLSRKPMETIGIKLPCGEMIEITLIEIRGDKCRIGVVAPKHIPVHRGEIWDIIQNAIDEN